MPSTKQDNPEDEPQVPTDPAHPPRAGSILRTSGCAGLGGRAPEFLGGLKTPSLPFASQSLCRGRAAHPRALSTRWAQLRGSAEPNETSRGDFNEGTTQRARTIGIPSPRFLQFLVSHDLGRLLVFPCLSSLFHEPGGDPAAFCPLSTTALKRTGLGQQAGAARVWTHRRKLTVQN